MVASRDLEVPLDLQPGEAAVQSEQRLRQAQKMEAIGHLAGGVAHDFNNLLGVILGYCEMLQTEPTLSEPVRQMVRQIECAGNSAKSLTHRLLTFSHRQIIEPVALDLNKAVMRTEAMLARLIGENIILESELSARSARIKADPSQIELMLMNLAINARDAMPNGGKIVIRTDDVTISESGDQLLASGRYVRLTVSDTGIGMDAEVQSHIFEPFFSTKPAGKGTGLGLSSVFGIVKQSRGSIAVASELGRGATFTVHLPRCEEAPASLRPVRPPALRGGTETVLLVDDSAPLRALMRRLLEGGGYCVLEAGDPAEALRIAESHPGPVSLLITDVVMPGCNGAILAENIARLRPEARVLYTSGYTSDAVVPFRMPSQGCAFLEKPFTREDLLTKVRAQLDSAMKLPPRSQMA